MTGVSMRNERSFHPQDVQAAYGRKQSQELTREHAAGFLWSQVYFTIKDPQIGGWWFLSEQVFKMEQNITQ